MFVQRLEVRRAEAERHGQRDAARALRRAVAVAVAVAGVLLADGGAVLLVGAVGVGVVSSPLLDAAWGGWFER